MPKDSLLKALAANSSALDMELIEKAYEFSAAAHAGQKRKSGDDFIWHAVEVVRILVDLNLYDSVTIASALIHDVCEDTGVSLIFVVKEFGEEVASLVDGLTKIGRMDGYNFRSVQEEQVENYRKLILSMARDIRVILIKFADRLHNMRTLFALPEEKKRRIARETLDVYAPLAHRFGIALIRWELEDLAFKYLEPEKYKKLAKQVSLKRGEREKSVEQFKQPLQKAIDEAGIKAEVTGRPKHLYSIHNKMERRSKSFEEIYDLLGLRVLTESLADCYHVLGIVHSTWTPLHVRFKDYIATPKSNMYQSLHTTVYGAEGQMIEVQIRTREMHRTAEYGIAAHWRFKEGKKIEEDMDRRMTWLRE
ncbi:MAG: HD domain-containing protein, partial [Candidatus Glassbacteria bacterium]